MKISPFQKKISMYKSHMFLLLYSIKDLSNIFIMITTLIKYYYYCYYKLKFYLLNCIYLFDYLLRPRASKNMSLNVVVRVITPPGQGSRSSSSSRSRSSSSRSSSSSGSSSLTNTYLRQ